MKIIDYKRGNDEGGILINGKDQYIAVTVSTSKKFKSLRGAQKFLESYGYKEVRGKHSVGQARKSKRYHRLRGFHDEWYVVIEKNLPRRTSRMIDYDYGEENMYDNVVMKILDWAYDNNDKALIKSLNNLKNSKDFVKRTGSKIPYGYSTDIYGDKEWEILEVSKENFEELGEEYPDIYDRFKDDFDEEDIDY